MGVKALAELEILLHKYNVPTFSPFIITRAPLVTFQVLFVNVDTQPSPPNLPFEIRFSLDLEHALLHLVAIGFHYIFL